ncbi:dethiobiotin synthase [Acetobacter tropicalis]|uniref:ATP-dependent dethiobiotin synthetase BioD n=1 Tax=Acetobacter tropicalis TaxID=104102 RepID=A0A094ZFB8_9PROT|nr:dethiobiotin synthase [Acetobacter tropicalis]KAA8389477.1 dethiobiotin synthase [Acetobacter tropicalis]KAA8390868.1 dethiobiotin synthase [Acetobacter tropicalis]KGB21251.1 Dethiobiotin synthetase [Acetobacter tropicalis]MBC9008612.1 dethiobiotin synthase [Acetobacter tropicalis]MDO8170307.1 dethiobiotin synthase [Acetobacter tropicalis]
MGQNTDRRALVRDRFDRAVGYEGAATMQRVAAQRLFEKLQERMEGRVPLRILELGCGTGFLTEKLRNAWPQADIVATDIAPHMLERAQQRVGEGLCYRIMDAGEPDVSGPFDIVCGNLVFQWLEHPQQAIARLGRLLSPGGILALSTLMDGTFQEWRTACAVEHEESGTPDYPSAASIGEWYPSLFNGGWETEACVQTFSNGRAFLRHLKETGASVPRAGYRPMQLSALRRSLARFDAQGSVVTWRLAYGCFQKPPRAGVFITGTDTGVGKTFVSACLVKAWEALYWKPLQSGLAEEAGDTPTILSLTHCAPEDCLPPAGAFQAPLSPEAAARAEGVTIDPASLALRMQEPERPMVVEGAGGLMVPATETLMMCDLAAQWGLPVVLVARSGLGTLNHTLLSLEALRQRGIAMAGVVLNGPLNPANRETITEKGKVRILAEIPFQADVSAQSVEGIAQTLPSWADVRGGA